MKNDKKRWYYPGYTDYEKNEYSSKYLGICFKCPKNFVLDGKTYNVIDIDGKYPDLKVTSHLHYYIRNVKKNYVAIVFEGSNKKDIKKIQKAFKKYK